MVYLLLPLTIATAALAGFNLVLTVGLIRRMRRSDDHSAHGTRPVPELLPGTAAPAELGPVAGRTVVGVFSTECSVCPEQLPDFAEVAREFVREGANAVAVLSGEPERLGAYREALGEAPTIIEDCGDGPMGSGPVNRGLRIRALPSYVLLDASGRVEAVGLSLAELPLRRPVPA